MAEEAIFSDFDLDLVLDGLAMREDASGMERVVKSLGEQIKLSRERLVYIFCLVSSSRFL